MASAKFCHECGRGIQSKTNTTGSLRRPSFASQKTQEKVQEGLSGAKKLVTIVFADISGFTALCEKLEAEAVSELMNRYMGQLGNVVYEFEGYIDKFIGDCIMALFGAPIAHENDPELAVRSALRMLSRLDEINQNSPHPLSIRIGINTGVVVTGALGSDQAVQYTVLGDAVNVAQRLQSSAEKNQILVGRQVAKACQHLFDFQEIPKLKVKGREEEVEAFRVAGFKSRAVKRQGLRDNQNRLIGRKKEISEIHAILEGLQTSLAAHFLVEGEAGSGKSRLKLEMRKMAEVKNFRWVETSCSPTKSLNAWTVLKELLRPLMENSARASTEIDEVSLAAVAQLLKHTHSDAPETLAPHEQKKLFLHASRNILEVYSRTKPLILFIDDIQFADPESRELIQLLIETKSASFLIAGAYRIGSESLTSENLNFKKIPLAKLTALEIKDLAAELLQSQELPENLIQFLVEKSGGNPLFIEEILKTMLDEGKLYHRGESYKIAENFNEASIPTSIQGLLNSRIDRLYQIDREVLEYAAVIGRAFDSELLAKASGLEEGLHESLQFLRKKEFIFETAVKSDVVHYVFNHLYTRQVVYEGLLSKRKQGLHLKVAKALEQISLEVAPEKQNDFVEDLAHHHQIAAAEPNSILKYSILAAELALKRAERERAKNHLLHCLRILETSSQSTDSETHLRVLDQLAEISGKSGDWKASDQYLKQAIALAQAKQNYSYVLEAVRRAAENSRLQNQFTKARKFIDAGFAVAEKTQLTEAKLKLEKSEANLLKAENQVTEALDAFKRILENAKQLNLSQLTAETLNDVATLLIPLGHLDQAQTALEDAASIAKQTSLRTLLLSVLQNLGAVQLLRGNFEDSKKIFEEILREAKKSGDLLNEFNALQNLALTLSELKLYPEAQSHFQKAVDLGKILGKTQSLTQHPAAKLFKLMPETNSMSTEPKQSQEL